MTNRYYVDHATMRDMNLALVLDTISIQAPLSRASLAQRTGLNKATVSSLVKELLQAGWVKEVGIDYSSSEAGRPAINLELNPDAGYFIGVEIGVNFISISIVNFAIQIISRRYESTENLLNQEAVLDRFFYLLRESRDQIEKMGKPLFGVGIGVPGLVDATTGEVLIAPNLGWQQVKLRETLEKEFDFPLFLGNEANLAALGESSFGAGQDINYMLYVSSGVGLGGGIVSNNRLLEGATGFAGEVGHMIVEYDGLPCNCGSYGCWETVAGEQALIRRVQEAVEGGKESIVSDLTGGNRSQLSLPLIIKAADAGDRVACDALRETAEWLGIGIASLMNVLNPQRVVFGGPLSEAHEYLLPVIKETIKEKAWHWIHDDANIVIARFGRDAAVIGGVAMVYREMLNRPREWLVGFPIDD